MSGDEYQELAMRTSYGAYGDDSDRLHHGVLGLCSEAGEVAGIFQKGYQGHEINIDHVIEELGDCMWMIAEICEPLGVSMDYVMDENIKKLQRRYPDGFSAERSVNRDKYSEGNLKWTEAQ